MHRYLLRLLYPVRLTLALRNDVDSIKSAASLELLITTAVLGRVRNSPSDLVKAVYELFGVRHSKSTYSRKKVSDLIRDGYLRRITRGCEEYLEATSKGALVAGKYIAFSRTVVTLPIIAVSALLAGTIAPQLTKPVLLIVLALYVGGLASLLWLPPPKLSAEIATRVVRIAPVIVTIQFIPYYVAAVIKAALAALYQRRVKRCERALS